MQPKPIFYTRLPEVSSYADSTYSYFGDLGDLIYMLPILLAGPATHLRLYSAPGKVREPFTKEKVDRIKSFLEYQPYILSVSFGEPMGKIMDGWRGHFISGLNLTDIQCRYAGLPHPDRELPWLRVDQINTVAKVIIHRSARYPGKKFPYSYILKAYKDCAFVGTEEEYKDFVAKYDCPELPYHSTPTLMDLARVIAGCDLFVGNQSTPRAIAEGLKVPVWVEQFRGRQSNTHWYRAGATYDSTKPQPDQWTANYIERAKPFTLLTQDRLAVIADRVKRTRGLSGPLAVLGCYRGGCALTAMGVDSSREMYLYDTFAGIPEDDVEANGHKSGEFAADLNSVKNLLRLYKVKYRPGMFPGTVLSEDMGLRFSYVHLDGDSYQSTKAGLEFFVPRMLPGGFIVLDDYDWCRCPGVKRAVEELGLTASVTAPQQAVLSF